MTLWKNLPTRYKILGGHFVMIANFSQHQAKYTSRSSYVVSIYKIYLLNNTLY